MFFKNLAYAKGGVCLGITNTITKAPTPHFRWLTQLMSREPLHPCVSQKSSPLCEVVLTDTWISMGKWDCAAVTASFVSLLSHQLLR